MINNSHKYLYWKTNSNEFAGFKPGELLVVEYHSGGGFAGAPEVLKLTKIKNIANGQPVPDLKEFPPPSTNLEYHIGGRAFSNYAYFEKNRAGGP